MNITRTSRRRVGGHALSILRWRHVGAGIVAVLGFCSASIAQVSGASIPSGSACLPAELVERSNLILLGMHGGGTDTPYLLPGTRDAAKVVAVVGQLSKPTFLILAAFRPTIWDLSGLTGRPITGIYVSGYYSQGVTGVDADIPIVFRHSAADNGPDPASANSPCPELRWPDDRPGAMSAAIRIRRAFGKWPSEYYGSSDPVSFRIGQGPVPPHSPIPDPGTVRAEGPLISEDPEVQRNFERNHPVLPPEAEARWAEQRRAELRGRRLLHIRWNGSGELIEVEPELPGDDELSE